VRTTALARAALLLAAIAAPARGAGEPGPAAGDARESTSVRLARIEEAMWSRDARFVPTLRSWARVDPEEAVRERSLGALAVLGDTGAAAVAADRLAADPSPRVRRAAAEAAWVLRLAVDPALLARACERDPDPRVRAECARALGRLGMRQGASVLLARAAADPSPEVRAVAVEALGHLRLEEAGPLLRHAALRDDSPLVRLFAVRALADAKDRDARGLFREIVETAHDQDLRVEAFRGLLRADASQDLISAGLADPDDRIRFLACERWIELHAGPQAHLVRGSEPLRRLASFLADPLPGIRDLAREALSRHGFRVRPSGLGFSLEE